MTMKLPRLSPKWAPYVFISPFLLLFVVFGRRIVNSIGFTGIK